MADAGPISWRSIIYGTAVLASGGERVGSVSEVLGSDGEDIFHGIRVALDGGHREVLVAANDVASLSTDAVTTDLARPEFAALPAYDEEATYHLASVGWLRRHLGWVRDAESDEEPG
jgi:uncharacterized protein YrrD